MKFNFYPIESRIYDFLEFPRLVFPEKVDEERDRQDSYLNKLGEFFVEFLKGIQVQLLPFQKEIDLFYMRDNLDWFDFSNLISKANSFFGYRSEKEYLEMLLTLDEHQIRRSIIYSILRFDQNIDAKSEDIMSSAEKISQNKTEILDFIKDLPIESGYKWNLFLIVEDPMKYMKMYVELLERLHPIFEQAYSKVSKEVNEYGAYLENYLNDYGAEGLNQITFSILDANILDSDFNNIIISAIIPLSLSIVSSSFDKYIAWGLRMEEAFKAMREHNENKLNERVQIFKNLGDKTRYEVLKLIASGEYSTKNIANALNVSSATISYHLNALLTSKIIYLNKSNNKIGYTIDRNLLTQVFEDLMADMESSDES